MSSCLCIGGLLATIELGAWMLTAETGDPRYLVVISSWTGIIIAFCGMLVMTAPHVSKALSIFSTAIIDAILPALARIQKHQEEINKGTLSSQIEDLKHLLKAASDDRTKIATELAEVQRKTVEERAAERAEFDRKHDEDLKAVRKSLHDVRDKMNIDALRREADIVERDQRIAELQQTIQTLTARIEDLQRTEATLQAALVKSQIRQDVQINASAAAIDETKAAINEIKASTSGEMPVVRDEGPKATG